MNMEQWSTRRPRSSPMRLGLTNCVALILEPAARGIFDVREANELPGHWGPQALLLKTPIGGKRRKDPRSPATNERTTGLITL